MFSFPKSSRGTAEGGSVFVVDTHSTRPPVPPRLSREKRRSGASQYLLFMLVSLAFFCIIIEACFIYYLYQAEQVSSASSSKQIGDGASSTEAPGEDVLPSKPVAHLTDGMDVVHDKHVMAWSMNAEPILYEMDYKDRGLVVRQQGYYYIYSKIFFSDSGSFYHLINLQTERYAGGHITLLQSRKYSPGSNRSKSNSFLGGVFHLFKNDAIYVNVSNTEKISRHKPYENFFGAFMI